ncbi:DUF3348 family protein [Ramlibacter sp. AN1015]|uniref:DUF3348 family protein n=1 Tax=Ramlibacter sp. AN1015 TaxID=3133428 RepID=UPI0030BF6E7E
MRTNFSASRLVRLLDAPHPHSRPPLGADFDITERLGHWVSAFDAVTLHALHQSLAALPRGRLATVAPDALDQLEAQFRSVRTVLVGTAAAGLAIAQESWTHGDAAGAAQRPSFAPLRRHYQEQQRQMGLKIDPLRAEARRVLSRASPGLRKLAMLDALWEQMLGAREHKSLAVVPSVLERRFEALRAAQAAAGEPAQSATWLQDFAHQARDVLVAEIDMRLQPVAGLIQALRSESKTQ